jgi:hypothetical protein
MDAHRRVKVRCGNKTQAMDPTNFLSGASRETTIRRDALGRWSQDGQPLDHPNLIRAFDRWLDRADDGRYCLRNDINWAYITLEGPPLFVRAVQLEPDGSLLLSLSNESTEPLAVATLRQGPDGALYCDARGGSMVARFDRHAMQQLEPVLKEDETGVYLALGSERVRPHIVADPLTASAQPATPP